MAFSVLKATMMAYMSNQEGIQSSDDWATQLTNAYDSEVKTGFQTINMVPFQSGNKAGMESLVKVACQIAISKRDGQHTFIDDIGKAVVNYWTGATLVVGIPPITPAPGSIQNITTTVAICSSPGSWSPVGPLSPQNSTSLFLDLLTVGMTTHLTTLMFSYATMSLYPSAPAPIVLPGALVGGMFTVPT